MEPAEEAVESVARSLDEALARMSFQLEPGRFCLLGFAEPPRAADLDALRDPPGQIVRESGETTLLAREEELAALCARHPSARVERGLAWIRFESPMGWELVGFLALVTGRLAAAGVPLGCVCGFSRDHLFVAERHLPRALEVLRATFRERRPDA